MTGNARQTPQERVCGPIVAGHEQDTTSDGTGPQNGPEGTVDMESLQAMRLYVSGHKRMDEFTRSTLLVYANEIEREVGGYDEMLAFCKRTQDASERREDVTLWGVDYTALPVDAEGVSVRVGDVMEWPDHSTAEVVGIGDGTFFYVEEGEDAAEWSCAFNKIHHHAPTVEDVLREFIDALDIDRCDDPDATIAEFAKRLRLAGGE